MPDIEVDAYSLAMRLAAALDAHRIPYAIGGAHAFGLWGDPRGTYDVDINLFVDHDELDRALDVIEAQHVKLDREAARIADQSGDTIVGWHGDMRVDLFTPSIPFAWEAMENTVRVQGPEGDAAFLSAEAIAIFKLMFFRPKDLLDVEKLVEIQGGALDTDYIRSWIVRMMGEDDERTVVLDEIVKRRR